VSCADVPLSNYTLTHPGKKGPTVLWT